VSIWHAAIVRILRDSGLFSDVQLAGGKVRAVISPITFGGGHSTCPGGGIAVPPFRAIKRREMVKTLKNAGFDEPSTAEEFRKNICRATIAV
jgi:hypothetical protein